VSETIIAAIRARHDEEGDVIFDVSRIEPGQLVKILDGPFTGLQAAFAEPDDRKRSFILLDLLGKTHLVKIANDSFEVAV
jgi:transcription antitermination factor NusG